MINILIWSKDRASQLDLTLQTFKKYFKEWSEQKVTILCKWSSENYELGYDKVKLLHPEFTYIQETDFRSDTLKIIFGGKETYVSFLVDDDIFVNPISLDSPEFKEFESNTRIAALSPRLAPHIDYCYTQNRPAKKPTTMNENRVWKWNDGCSGDWNYPWSVAGLHIFRRDDLRMVENIPFKAPNSFEAALCNIGFIGKPHMICFDQVKTFTGANNRVQVENNNRHENSAPIDVMNATFLNDKRLSVIANDGLVSNSCHGPVKYEWI